MTRIFIDRVEAGRLLAEKLIEKNYADPVILALPRGGVPVGAEIAEALNAPLDVVLVRKIGVPSQPELAVGAVVDGSNPQVVVNEDVRQLAGVSREQFEQEKERQLGEIERRRKLYLNGRERAAIKGKTAIVVDDGIATGATVRAALKALRQDEPARLVLAVPVAPPDTVAQLRASVDDLICLQMPEPFYAIGLHYSDFAQISDDEVVAVLKRRREALKAAESEKR